MTRRFAGIAHAWLTAVLLVLACGDVGPAAAASLQRGTAAVENVVSLYFNDASLTDDCLKFRVTGFCVKFVPPASVALGVAFSYSEPVAFVETGATEGFTSFLPVAGELIGLVNAIGFSDYLKSLILGELLPGVTDPPSLPNFTPSIASAKAGEGHDTQFVQAHAFGIPYVYSYIVQQSLPSPYLLDCDDKGSLCGWSLAYASELDFCWVTGLCDLFDVMYGSIDKLASGEFAQAGTEFASLFTTLPGFCLLDVADRAASSFEPDPNLQMGDVGPKFTEVFQGTDGFGIAGPTLTQTFGTCADCGFQLPGADYLKSVVDEYTSTMESFQNALPSIPNLGPISDFTGSAEERIQGFCLGSWGPLRMRHGHEINVSDLVAHAKAGYTAANLGYAPGMMNINYLWSKALQGVSFDPSKLVDLGSILSKMGIDVPGSEQCSGSASNYVRFDPKTEIYNRMTEQELFPKIDTCNDVGDVPLTWQAADKLEPWGDLVTKLASAESPSDVSVVGGSTAFTLWNRQGCCLFLVTIGV